MKTIKSKKRSRLTSLGGTRSGTVFPDSEEILEMEEAASLPFFQRKGKPVSTQTMRIHRLRGLECMYMGSRWVTSRQAVDRYIRKLNSKDSRFKK